MTMDSDLADIPLATAEPAGGLSGVTDLLALGGPVVAILLCLSVLALAIVAVKIVRFWPILTGSTARLDAALHAARGGDIVALQAIDRPAGRIGCFALSCIRAQDPANARERIEDRALAEIADMRRHLRLLEIIAQIAPLLGLLGTILGMIEAFKVIEASPGAIDPAALAGGIWVALLTTAVGLGVAIPAAAALYWLDGIVEAEQRQIEHVATAILTGAEPPSPGMAIGAATAPLGPLGHAPR